jgi:Uma2 family endonuclease
MTTASHLKEFADTQAMVVPLTVDQYHEMIAAGILLEGEPIELLDGMLVRKDRSKAGEDPMTVGHHHVWVLAQIQDLVPEVNRLGGRLRIQAPITLPPDSEPEPDATIARAKPGDYIDGHPRAHDITCLIEVADSSLQHDRVTKQRIYADHDVSQYLIVNLIDGVIEEFREPQRGTGSYATQQVIRRDEMLSIDVGTGQQLTIPAATLLP